MVSPLFSVSIGLALVLRLEMPLEPEQRTELLDACTRAHGGEPCRWETEGKPPSQTSQASVVIRPAHDEKVGLYFYSEQGEFLGQHELEFSPKDDEMERAKAIGLTAGALFRARFARPASKTPATEPEEPRLPQKPAQAQASQSEQEKPLVAAKPESVPSTPAPQPFWVFAAAGSLQYLPEWAQLGPAADLSLAWASPSGVSVQLRGGVGAILGALSKPTLAHLGASAGVGWHGDWGRGSIRGFASLGAEGMRFGIEETSASRATGISRFELSYLAPLSEHLRLDFGPSLDLFLSPSHVYVDGTEVGRTGSLRLGLRVGLAWSTRKR